MHIAMDAGQGPADSRLRHAGQTGEQRLPRFNHRRPFLLGSRVDRRGGVDRPIRIGQVVADTCPAKAPYFRRVGGDAAARPDRPIAGPGSHASTQAGLRAGGRTGHSPRDWPHRPGPSGCPAVMSESPRTSRSSVQDEASPWLRTRPGPRPLRAARRPDRPAIRTLNQART